MTPPTPGLYVHYKGNHYRLLFVALHSETHEPLCIYVSVGDSQGHLWARPMAMWSEEVTLPDGSKKPRFAPVEEMTIRNSISENLASG
jgi:hypothetical protein